MAQPSISFLVNAAQLAPRATKIVRAANRDDSLCWNFVIRREIGARKPILPLITGWADESVAFSGQVSKIPLPEFPPEFAGDFRRCPQVGVGSIFTRHKVPFVERHFRGRHAQRFCQKP
jgi:hypothetical protein